MNVNLQCTLLTIKHYSYKTFLRRASMSFSLLRKLHRIEFSSDPRQICVPLSNRFPRDFPSSIRYFIAGGRQEPLAKLNPHKLQQ